MGTRAAATARWVLVFWAGAFAAVHAIAASDAAVHWNFTAYLDGAPIGTHRYTRTPVDGDGFALTTSASFDVRLLGIAVYAYRYRAREDWERGCLKSVDAHTDDNGKVNDVVARAVGGRLDVTLREAAAPARTEVDHTGCAMSFAYWKPLAPGTARLFDASTGRATDVTISALAETTIDVAGKPTPARGLRITGLAHPIDVWYAGDRWIGLDTTVDHGRHLAYRIE